MDLVKKRAPDYWLALAVIALVGLGLVMVYSASAIVAQDRFGDSSFFFKRQALWVLLGTAAAMIAQRIHYEQLRRVTPFFVLVTLVVLTLVLIPGVGRIAGGARRWLSIGPASFQPAEAAKMAMALYMARFLTSRTADVQGLQRGVLPPVLLAGLMLGLILLQPDMGSAILVGLVMAAMLFVGGARLLHLLGLSLAGAPILAVAVLGEEYRRRRILAFLDPWADPQGMGFHIIQSLLALGSGGIFGVGLGASRQKYFYLPERHTDFIFAIVGEELGLIGTASVLLLFALFAYRGFRIARAAPTRYAGLLASGITAMVLLQAVVNIGVTTGMLPITGVPLPFLSFGGSSLVFTMIGVGIVLNISQYAVTRERGNAVT
ncbi:MAG: putative lipid II flippase FtsW [Armatimonadetes bacterium]|nr:putative lipid II flippase FtsW [Armatimonadota bacterium]MBI2201285.1 putative lipid II flippase FtsW [Armatimonadota bacterium]MBI2972569.1 putative lipid II flippase FtsW [Armatimonadota bacterium]